MYKLIALDMDGTLLNSQKQISQQNRDAIAKAKAMGVVVVLASGRPTEGMHSMLQELTMNSDQDFVLSYNASFIQNMATKEVILNQHFNGKALKKLATLAKSLETNIHAFSPTLGLITPKTSRYTEQEAHYNGLSITEMDFHLLDDDHPIIKAMFIDEPQQLDTVIARLSPTLYQQFTIVQSAPYFLEFLNPEANKGFGVKMLAEHLGIKQSEVICMGDAGNDYHMLKYAGLGIAMGNATDEIKTIADHITDTNDNHGVALAIERFVLSQS